MNTNLPWLIFSLAALWLIFSLAIKAEADPGHVIKLLKHQADKRVIRGFQLKNGIKVVTISDPGATESIVRLCVKWGLLDCRDHFKDVMSFFEEKFMELTCAENDWASPTYHEDFTYFDLTAPHGVDFGEELAAFAKIFETRLGNVAEEKEAAGRILERLNGSSLLSREDLEDLWNLLLLRSEMCVVVHSNLPDSLELHSMGHAFDGLRERKFEDFGIRKRMAGNKYLYRHLAELEENEGKERFTLTMEISLTEDGYELTLVTLALMLFGFEHEGNSGFQFHMPGFSGARATTGFRGNSLVVKIVVDMSKSDAEWEEHEERLLKFLSRVESAESSEEQFRSLTKALHGKCVEMANNEKGKDTVSRISTGLMHFPMEDVLVYQYLLGSESYEKFKGILEKFKDLEDCG
jgi:hypothetical protein